MSEQIFEEIIVENFPDMGKESHPSPRSPERFIQDKPQEKHINQTNKN